MRFSNGTLTVSNTGDMSQATLTSAALDVRHLRWVGIQAVMTGAPVGTLQLYGSADNTTFTAVGTAAAISAAGNYVWDIVDTGLAYWQVGYAKTSGTGTLTVKWSAKGD